MTVQELIERLEKVRDKSIPVVLVDWSIQNPMMARADLSAHRFIVQPHRVAIITD